MAAFLRALLFGVVAAGTAANLEAAQWLRSYGPDLESAASLQPTSDGGYIVAGNTWDLPSRDAWLARLDPDGGVVWSKKVNGSGPKAFVAVQPSRDGSYVFAGPTEHPDWTTHYALVWKVSDRGEVIWQRTYGGERSLVPTDIKPTSDGGYVVAGYSAPFGGGLTSGWILRLDGLGNILWERRYADRTGTWSFKAIQPTSDGGYIVAGNMSPLGVSDFYDAWVVKVDAGGDITWQRTYGCANDDGAMDIRATIGGDYIMAGYTSCTGTPVAWIVRLTGDGNVVWQRAYGDVFRGEVNAIEQDPDGGFVVVGFADSYPNFAGSASFMWKIDDGGNVAWQRGFSPGGPRGAVALRRTLDGGYIVGGFETKPYVGGRNALVLRLGASGSIDGCVNPTPNFLRVTDTSVAPANSTVSAVAGGTSATIDALVARDDSLSWTEQCRYAEADSPGCYQGLWWAAPAGTQSGWGINFAHQNDVIFATWFTFDVSGRPLWLSMTAEKTGPGTYSGVIYQTNGPPLGAQPFDPILVTRSAVGSGTLEFTGLRAGTFIYSVNGNAGTKAIVPQEFGPMPTCVWSVWNDPVKASNYQDLWWASPPASESGWGVNLAHQGDKIFATWFTYDADGRPLWLSATTLKTAVGNYVGTLYSATGPAFDAVPFNPDAVKRSAVGTLQLTFRNGNAMDFAYRAELPGSGLKATMTQMTRQVFRAPGTVCY